MSTHSHGKQRSNHNAHAHRHGTPARQETWREKLLSYATVTATAALIWIWAANQTRQSAEANCRVHFLPSDADSQSVGPDEPIPVRLEFTGSKSAVEATVNAVNGRIFDFTVGSGGIPSTPGAHDVLLQPLLQSIPAIRQSDARVRVVQPLMTTVAIEAIVEREARVVVRPAGRGALAGVLIEPTTVSVWIPAALAERVPATLTVEAVVPQTGLEESEVTLALPKEVAAIVGRVRIEPPRVRVRPAE